MSFTYEYPRPMVVVDCVVFGLADDALKVLLIRRARSPHQGAWALPGGFIEMDEPLETAALRELREETGVRDLYLEQLYTFGDPARDPRGRVISVGYYALVKPELHQTKAGDDAADAKWVDVMRVGPMAFDHAQILQVACDRLRAKVRYQPIGFELLPRKFTLSQLQRMYEVILGRQLDKRNFRRKMLKMKILIELPERQADVPHRAARLYRFDRRQYQRLASAGFNFEI
ncbi:MAG: NUDIX hydrolase [Phycisphaerae bacterium]|nr:NUDIX hydrolase [Phycisphaerae bacterium]